LTWKNSKSNIDEKYSALNKLRLHYGLMKFVQLWFKDLFVLENMMELVPIVEEEAGNIGLKWLINKVQHLQLPTA